MLKNILIFSITLFIFAGCSIKEVQPLPEPSVTVIEEEENPQWVKQALYKEYDKWCETPYKLGGQGSRGIDCSSLVQNVYYDAFGIKLPRATDEQAKVGYEIPLNSSKEGDLVFFKTGRKTRHAGIIIDKGQFLHSSTTDGVTISQLNNPYWKNTYWQTRRVLP
jgi:lipoprotein Spr/probable lipoprotein NlpC